MTTVRLPKKLEEAFDTYYQTSAFARKNFLKFNRELVMQEVTHAAKRCGYEVKASEGKSAGEFTLTRKSQTLRVTRSKFPLADVRA